MEYMFVIKAYEGSHVTEGISAQKQMLIKKQMFFIIQVVLL
jgi:hypothetical protein